jgi:succinylglutamate desuccinylase
MKILFVGGIHGDEKTGVNLCRMQGCTYENPYIKKSINGIDYGFLIASPRACLENVHFLDHNLNDCFGCDDVHEGYEYFLQKELCKAYGMNSNDFADIVVDFHTTNADTNLLMFPSLDNVNPNLLTVASDLGITPYYCPNDFHGNYCDQYLGKSGITIELSCLSNQENMQALALLGKYVSRLVKAINTPVSFRRIPGLAYSKTVYYPKNESGYSLFPDCMVSCQTNKISKGEALLINPLNGKIIEKADDEYIALFMNCPSYYEFGQAMTLAKKSTFDVGDDRIVIRHLKNKDKGNKN